MSQIASASQLRMSLVRWALFTIPTLMVLGLLSGVVSGSGEANSWYQILQKPAVQPPGWVFGVVWPILYLMQGLALAIILNVRGAPLRWPAVALFGLQFVMNLSWSPLFFGRHEVTSAFYLLIAIWITAFATTMVFGRIRKAAAWLLVPYMAWLSFAGILNYQIDALNPDAESLYVPAASAEIGG